VDINGILTIAFRHPVVIPIKVWQNNVPEKDRKTAEDQIAEYVKADCEKNDISAAHVFHDATGRGSLGTAFARLWRADTNPIEFGGKPTARPVQNDLYIYDEETRQRRLKRCDEHYVDFVTELAFSVRYAIEARQVKGLTNNVVDEMCAREWGLGRGKRIEMEEKAATKKRLGRSPDMADWANIAVEGARRLGFTISKLETRERLIEDDTWKDRVRQRFANAKRNFVLDLAR
jgi:hypothetical protein